MNGGDIDRKLCLTAALVGARTRKDLAAAFRRANPRTSFDIERANKWLQGRARPREQQIYDDWALVLDIGRSGAWIADCDFDAFLDEICAHRNEERAALLRRAQAFGGGAERSSHDGGAHDATEGDLVGTFACYSHAWSSFFRGRLLRGALTIEPRAGGGCAATYRQTRAVVEGLVTNGGVTIQRRGLVFNLLEPQGRIAFMFTLFPPMSLGSVLGGLMCGPAIYGPDPQPSVTRIVIVRLLDRPERLFTADCILQPGASVAADLAELGMQLSDPEEADRLITAFLSGGDREAFDLVAIEPFRALVELFDREWIGRRFPAAMA